MNLIDMWFCQTMQCYFVLFRGIMVLEYAQQNFSGQTTSETSGCCNRSKILDH